MPQQSQIQLDYQALLHQLDAHQVVLLHPQNPYRTLVIAQLVNDPNVNKFYYAMGPDDIDLQSFIYSITHDMTLQHPTFGRHLNTLPASVFEDINANFDLILHCFVRELEEMSDSPYVLIFDEYDRSDIADDMQRFIERLSINLPSHCHVVFNGRTLPRLSWLSLIAQNKAAMLLNNQVITQDFYGLKNDQNGSLEVYALGPGFVLLNNHYIDAWEGHLPRLLFFFALDRPVITRSDICTSFWPDLNPEQAVNVFHVTKRRLHKALDVDVLTHDDGYYAINPELGIYYDVLEFVEALLRGRNTNLSIDDRITAWQRAIHLYRGPFLQGHDDRWILERRIDFRAGYIEALQFMANIWKEKDRPEQALALLQKALAEDLRVDEVNQEVMRLYVALGRRNEAAGHYQRVLQDYHKDGLQPSDALHALYQEVTS